jgi:hypothetical protein
VQIEKFDSVIIEKNLDLQDQIKVFEQNHKKIILENSRAAEIRLEQVVANNAVILN